MKKSIATRLARLLALTLVCCLLPGLAAAEKYYDADQAWGVFSRVVNRATRGSEKLKTKLEKVFKQGLDYGEDTQVGGHGAIGENGQYFVHGNYYECAAYALAFMDEVFSDGYTGKQYMLKGKGVFTYDDFVKAGIPQHSATLVRTSGLSSIDDKYGDWDGHSMVLLYYDQDYIYYLGGNDGGPGAVTFSKYTWEEWTEYLLTWDDKYIKYTQTVPDEELQRLYPAFVRLAGDVTGDGAIDIMDVIRLLKYVSGWGVQITPENSDVTADNGIDIMDVIRILKYVSGWGVALQ